MALSEFFPYGAPELLDGAPARMARSTLTASLAVTFLVVAAGALMPRAVLQAVSLCCPPPPDVLLDVSIFQPPPALGPPVPPAEIAHPDATPIAVPDAQARDIAIADPFDGLRVEQATGVQSVDGGHTGPIGPNIRTRDPEPGDFVWTSEMPVAIRCKDAVYPDLARSAGVEGMVTVLMLVGLNGRVERAIVPPQHSIPMLDQAALDAALTCVFTPALADGHPVKVWVSQNYRFSLHSAP